MKRIKFWAVFAAAFPLLLAADYQWHYAERLPLCWNGVDGTPADTIRTPDGEAVLTLIPRYSTSQLEWPSIVTFTTPAAEYAAAETAELSFWVRGPAGRKLAMRLTAQALKNAHYSNTEQFKLTGDWQKLLFRAEVRHPLSGAMIDAPRLILADVRAGDRIELGELSMRILDARQPDQTADAVACPKNWQAIDTSELLIEPGSALDFSNLVSREPAGSFGRVIASADGRLAFAQKPTETVRFMAVQFIPFDSMPSIPPTYAELDTYAAAVARQGYNMVRLHFLDEYLSGSYIGAARLKPGVATDRSLPTSAAEIKIDPVALDRFFYLVAALKRNGVYLNWDCMTSFAGYDNGRSGIADVMDPRVAKVQLFVSGESRRNWAAGVERILSAVNPYTGMSLRDDPALAMVCALNEQDILIGFRDYREAFRQPFTDYLKRRYGNYAALRAAWHEEQLPENGSFDDVPMFGARRGGTGSAMERDLTGFAVELMREMTAFYRDTLTKIGYRGLYSNWNMRPFLSAAPARSDLPLLMMNSYHAHPRFDSGIEVPQDSALSTGGNSFKAMAGVRFLDRPFACTEFALCFWNRFRHEQGLLFGAGAAQQDWSVLTCHATQVMDSGRVLNYFKIGDDPVARASEQLAMFAFLRGDVAASPHRIGIQLTDEFINANRVDHGLSDEYTRLWPLAQLGIAGVDNAGGNSSDLLLTPVKTSAIGGGAWFTESESSGERGVADEVIARLHREKILSAENRSDAARGILQSDTGELTLFGDNGGELHVVTPRLAGAAVKFNRPVELGAFSIREATTPAALAVVSLDAERSLEKSGRLLCFAITDARNSGMEFEDAGESRLKSLGTLPVIVRTGRFVLSLRRDDPRPARCYALDFAGRRIGELPVELTPDGWRWVIDPSAGVLAPGFLYELEEVMP